MKLHKRFQSFMAALCFFSVLLGCRTFLARETLTLTPVVSTETFIPTFSPSDTSTPAPSVTPSPRPTKTATPVPVWITDFAEPILAAIADRPPDFEEDFSEVKPGGYLEKMNCPENGCVITDGVLAMAAFPEGHKAGWAVQPIPCCEGFKSFVMRVDVNTAKLKGENAANIAYNDVLGKGIRSTMFFEYNVELKSDRRWFSIIGGSLNDSGQLPRSVPPQITYTLIMRGSKYAVYLNDTPITHGAFRGGKYQPEFELRAWSDGSGIAEVEYDNLKIWSLDNIPGLPVDE